jgi:outer membrane protein assembly factor BamB
VLRWGALAAIVLLTAGAAGAAPRTGGDWTRFGYDAARSGSGPARTGITAANVGHLRRLDVKLDGTVDASAIYLRGVRAGGKVRDLFFVTTSYGKTLAIDAGSGKIVWRFTPPGYSTYAGTYRITNSTPVADPSRRFVYAVAPDGVVRKLSVASGKVAWATAITRGPEREKIAPPLNFSRGLVLAATGGYIGDEPPYQGHVVSISASTGRIAHVWNALCSSTHSLQLPATCLESGAAIWARSGVIVEPGSGRLLVATGDGRFDGSRHWGDSVLELTPNASALRQNWTPTDQAQLDSGDVDLGTTAPAILSSTLIAQSGKDGKLRLLDLRKLSGKGGASPKTGGELQTLGTPGGEGLFSAPAVWRAGGTTWLFVASFGGTGAYRLDGGRLHEAWSNSFGGTSPVVAGGLLYVYDSGGALRVYQPASGKLVATLSSAGGHWNSPIVTDGRIALPVGSANDHALDGVLEIWH